MSKSKPRDLAWWFKMQYEVHFPQQTYMITGRDMKTAKEFCDANGEPDYALLETYLPQFWKADFWQDMNWPCYGFLGNLQRYQPRVKREFRQAGVVIECTACGHSHGINESCR